MSSDTARITPLLKDSTSITMGTEITIVIPVYNRAHTLGRTLRSIEGQKVSPARVILVDNNSTDDSWETMQRWSNHMKEYDKDVVLLKESKPGACAARNRGLKKVETSFVMFFDSDDEMLPDHVADFSEAIRKNPTYDIFGRSIECEESDGKRRKLYFTAKSPMFNHIFRGCLSTQRMVIRTELIRQTGGWDETLPAWNDYELGVRLLLATDRIMDIGGKTTVVTYHLADSITGTSYSSRHEHWEKSLDRVEKHFINIGRKDLARLTDARRMVLASQYRSEGDTCEENQMRENAICQAARLYAEVIDKTDSPWKMKAVYLHNRLFKRLTWALVRIIFPLG
ncbi:glycosyltransferase family A protein [uncultured Duncaniella sp.]|uniref:glycosyltransferase family A protein n=1 Tax=uncultured Duncaniella sp. TaxID=2768039 RepID=UPI00272F234F|nr:glycosyltransferase family A protein [uncultured Duncaniella sp.]